MHSPLALARAGYLEDSRTGKATCVSSSSSRDDMRDLFVYGTLKRGFAAHRRYCGDAIFVTRGAVLGRLHLHQHGYPVLAPAPSMLVSSPDWRWIEGEILRFRDPARSLRRIDAYEGVIPGIHGPYCREQVAVRAAGVRLAWAYVAASIQWVAGLPEHPACWWP